MPGEPFSDPVYGTTLPYWGDPGVPGENLRTQWEMTNAAQFTSDVNESLERVLAVAFRRWTVEHSFRLGKQEAGLMHFEGRDYVGLMRHLVLALVVLGFVATHTQRLRGENPQITAERDLLLPALHAVQDGIGWISHGALNYICRRLAVPPAEAWGMSLPSRRRVSARDCSRLTPASVSTWAGTRAWAAMP